MSDTWVSVLTPPSAGAIATVEVCGPRAHELARALFKPAGKPLPEVLEVSRFWFGTLGADEVVLAITGPNAIEVHCHGGRRVVRWVVEQFLASGGREPSECMPTLSTLAKCPSPTERLTERSTPGELNPPLGGLTPPARLLQFAPTLRTANILLDQLNGAFALEVQQILRLIEIDPASAKEPLGRIAELGDTIGRHLVEPWKVTIAGPPNVGKSSLVNALAGYQRTVVSEVAGTTRDAVSVQTAFDGWPVELIDTAGLREADGLEAKGIEHAKRILSEADFVVWLMDCSVPEPIWPPEVIPQARLIGCVTKSDLPGQWGPENQGDGWGLPLVSSVTGDVHGLVAALLGRMVPTPPAPGHAIPYSPPLIEAVNAASACLQGDEVARHLREALALTEAHTAGESPFPSKP